MWSYTCTLIFCIFRSDITLVLIKWVHWCITLSRSQTFHPSSLSTLFISVPINFIYDRKSAVHPQNILNKHVFVNLTIHWSRYCSFRHCKLVRHLVDLSKEFASITFTVLYKYFVVFIISLSNKKKIRDPKSLLLLDFDTFHGFFPFIQYRSMFHAFICRSSIEEDPPLLRKCVMLSLLITWCLILIILRLFKTCARRKHYSVSLDKDLVWSSHGDLNLT